MPNTPTTWLDDFVVNLTTSDSQNRPRITQLADGNILVVWDSANNTGVGASAGVDVIGQLFDQSGTRIGTEFRVNDGFFTDDERKADIAALPGGRFLSAFEDFDVANNTRSIRLTKLDADGSNPVPVTIIGDVSNNADPAYFNPRVAVGSSTSALIVYQEEEADGSSRIAGHLYDPDTDTVGAVISLINFPGDNTSPALAVLTNGNYVIAANTLDTGGNQFISYRMVNATGSNVLGTTRVADTDADGENDREASVTALDGGGFVIAWTNTDGTDTGIQARVFSSAGVAQGSLIEVTAGVSTNADKSAVVALIDGGFIVFFDDDQAGTLGGVRFDADGTAVGDAFELSSGGGGIDEIAAVLLDNGRAAVSFEGADGEIHIEIVSFPLIVTTLGDVVDAGDGLLSLREALTLANADSGADTVTFDASLINGQIHLATSLAIESDLTIDGDIDGDGRADITISGDTLVSGETFGDGIADVQIMSASNGADLTLRSLTLTHGTSAAGGAVYAGLFSDLTIVNSTIQYSSAYYSGGGVLAVGASIDIIGSTFHHNSSGKYGGAFYANPGSISNIINSTFALNSSGVSGGAITAGNGALLNISSSTITDNYTLGVAGGIELYGASLSLYNSVLAANFSGSGGNDLAHTHSITTGAFKADFSFVGNDVPAPDNAPGPTLKVGNDPMLGALWDNGGPVQTMLPLVGSPLIGAGANGSVGQDFADYDGDADVLESVPIDARGNPRVVGTAEIGAVENLATDNTRNTTDNLAIYSNVLTNDAPNSKIYGARAGAESTGEAIGPLSNGGLAFVPGTHGNLVIFADGTYSYIPNNALLAGVVATETFTYRMIHNATGLGDTAQLTINITGVNEAPIANGDDNANDSVEEATSTSVGHVRAQGNVLDNDTDLDTGDSKTVNGMHNGLEILALPFVPVGTISGIYGTLTLNANGTYEYLIDNARAATNSLAAGQTAIDYFTYRVVDSQGATDAAEIAIVITGANDAPLIGNSSSAASVAFSMSETTIPWPTAFTIISATDAESSPVTFSLSGADAALFSIHSSGALSFVAPPDFEAPTDAGRNNVYDVTVRASDSSGLFDEQAYAITITNTAGNAITGTLLPDVINGTTPVGNPATNEEDSIDGGAGDDNIAALGGNDTVRGGLGKDSMDGGAGFDTLTYSEKTKALTLVLNGATFVAVKVGAAEDMVANFESVIGGTGADKITGDGFDNFLSGEKGNDALTGGGGLDTLIGGLGNDKLAGGAGADRLEGGLGADALTGGTEVDQFLFNVAVTATNADKITDMTHDIDIIVLDDAFFAAIGPTLDVGEFVSGPKVTKALDANDFILYNTKTGVLSYDADGSGAGKAIKFATLSNKPLLLDHEDFMIV